MNFIFLFRATTARFPVKVGCFLLLLCLLTCANSWHWTSAQTKPQESGDAVVLSGPSMEWGNGPEYSYAKSKVLMASGVTLIDYEYSYYRSSKRFKADLKDCAKNAFRVVDDSDLLDVKGRKSGRRILAIFRDLNNQEGAVLCRSVNKKRGLRKIYGPEAEVLAYELREYPK